MNRYLSLLSVPGSSSSSSVPSLLRCDISINQILSPADEFASLQRRTPSDESYSLRLAADGSACVMHAPTVWGALRALESFTQLFTRTVSTGVVSTTWAPVALDDVPRYAHRGLLIDSSRHYLPVAAIEALIDAFPASKLNVLHWHMVSTTNCSLLIVLHVSIWFQSCICMFCISNF